MKMYTYFSFQRYIVQPGIYLLEGLNISAAFVKCNFDAAIYMPSFSSTFVVVYSDRLVACCS